MASFRIHRLKDSQRQQFRWAPHASGSTAVKPRDYSEAGAVEAPNVYAAWVNLRGTERPIEIGDMLEKEDGGLLICKYVGFEEARWIAADTAGVQ
jgi:hypothetical protein